ncbi:MAG: hypothetical protein QNK40_11475 [Desulfobacterales bacterium]|nr:hypothetical protein [Desulfobacterales bacterium]
MKEGPNGHHGINEIWLNKYNKWFLSDAKYDHHFEKNGVPLSALEIRDEYLKNKAAEIVKVKGPDRTVIDIDPETGTSKERSAQTYSWIEYHTNNNMFSVWPKHKTLLTVYEDDYFRNNTWIWGGKPHWAYKKPEFMIRELKREAIYWTPNTIKANVSIEGQVAHIELISDTPNLKEYQMKKMPSREWQKIENSLDVNLTKDAYEFIFRIVNLANVFGPEHYVKIQSE